MKTIYFCICTLALLILTACSDGGSSSSGSNAQQGVFIDSAVEGVSFTTATQSGTTDSAGTFSYLPGEIVSFYIGDILIGSAEGQGQLTPLNFVPGAVDETEPQVSNILRFVQSLDSDNDPDNGITISSMVVTQAASQSLDFSLGTAAFETAANALLSLLTSGAVTTLVDASTAQAHFVGNLGGGGPTVGSLTLSGTDTGLFGTAFTADPALTIVSAAFIEWRYDLPGSGFLQAAVVLNAGVITDVLFTWEDGLTNAGYGISCLGNPLPLYTVGDCSQMVLDTVAQEVTFNATIEVSTFLFGAATAPITVNGVLDY
ncbi:MAG: hypothetical protein GY785_22745 [Gammaproteobacteria bacterium]|nr:hypothetical protein [Gammaproteobacteria bacterium]